VEMFQPIDNDEEVPEERHPGNKKMKMLILPLIPFLLLYFSEN
jgi:hypothetical protein